MGLARAEVGAIGAAFYTRRACPDDPRFPWANPHSKAPRVVEVRVAAKFTRRAHSAAQFPLPTAK